MGAALKPGDIVKLAAVDASLSERFVVLGGACSAWDGPSWKAPRGAKWSAASKVYLVPSGYHVQSLNNGRLATYSAGFLERVGSVVAEIDGLLERPRVRLGRAA